MRKHTAEQNTAEQRTAHPPPPPPPTYMSSEDTQLLWDDEQAAEFLENKQSSPSPSQAPTQSARAGSVPATTNSTHARSVLHCEEDPLALEDWLPNEKEEYPYPEPVPESARALMEARMEAPQGGLDGSYASHSCQHPPRAQKRKRVYSVTWCSGQSQQCSVGMILYI